MKLCQTPFTASRSFSYYFLTYTNNKYLIDISFNFYKASKAFSSVLIFEVEYQKKEPHIGGKIYKLFLFIKIYYDLDDIILLIV